MTNQGDHMNLTSRETEQLHPAGTPDPDPDHGTWTERTEPAGRSGRAASGRRRLGLLAAVSGAAGRLVGARGAESGLGHAAGEGLAHGAAALGHTTAGGGAAGGGAASSGAAGAGQAGGSAAQTVAVGTGVAAAAAAVAVAVVAMTGGGDTEQAAPSTTSPPVTAPAPFEPVAPPAVQVGEDGPAEGTAIGAEVPDGVVVTTVEGREVGQPVVLDSGATVTVAADGSFRYDPADAFATLGGGDEAVDEFMVVVATADGVSAELTVPVVVTGTNDPPTIEPPPEIQLVEGERQSVTVTFTDVDSETVALAVGPDGPDFVTVERLDGGGAVLIADAPDGVAGMHRVTLVATDDGTPPMSSTTELTITVEPAAAPDPVRVSDGLAALYEFNEGRGSVVGSSTGPGSDLQILDPDAVTWQPGALTITAPTGITAVDTGPVVSPIIAQSNELTVEAWVTPAADQDGPARIVSLSIDPLQRNVTLAQGGPGGDGGTFWSGRVRTTTTGANGLPAITTEPGTATGGARTHLALTRSPEGTVVLFVDGVARAEGRVEGDLSTWDASFPLILANEATGDRPWLGTLHLVAIYDRALSPAEIDRNYRVGP